MGIFQPAMFLVYPEGKPPKTENNFDVKPLMWFDTEIMEILGCFQE